MSNDLSKQMLQLIEEYEEIPRDVLAYNTRKILNLQGMTQHEQDLWLAQLCGTTRNTTYSWFAPHRDAKVPLKVIVMIAADRSIPLQSFFEEVSERSEVVLRKKSPRPSYEMQITGIC